MPKNLHWKSCSADEWAEFLIKYDCYATEPEPDTMLHKHSGTKEPLAEVTYKPRKRYYVNIAARSPMSA